MTFQQLQYFLEVHRTGSVTKAAKNLYVSYPSVSIAIANIEKELGIVLFTRGPKGLSLTEQGQHVLECANTITQAYTQMNGLRQEGRRAVRINAGDYETIGTAFAKLIEENGVDSETDIMMTTCNTDDSFRHLVTGEVALSVLTYMSYNADNIEHRIKRDSLEGEDLARIPLEDVHYRMTAVTNPQRAKEPEVERFLQLLKQQIAEDYPQE